MKKHLFSFLACSVAITLGVTNFVLADNGFGNFNRYENGNLNWQDGWSDVWNSLMVQDIMVSEGTKTLKNPENFSGTAYKNLPAGASEVGVVSAEIKIDSNSFSDNQYLLGIFKGIGEEYIALFRFANNFDNRQNMLLLSMAESADVIELGQITQGEWHTISLGWRKSDFKIRVRVDNNDWSEWFDSQTSWGEGEPFGIRIDLPQANIYGDFYLSNLNLL